MNGGCGYKCNITLLCLRTTTLFARCTAVAGRMRWQQLDPLADRGPVCRSVWLHFATTRRTGSHAAAVVGHPSLRPVSLQSKKGTREQKNRNERIGRSAGVHTHTHTHTHTPYVRLLLCGFCFGADDIYVAAKYCVVLNCVADAVTLTYMAHARRLYNMQISLLGRRCDDEGGRGIVHNNII